MKLIFLALIFYTILTNAFGKTIKMGGSDTGGGTGIYFQNEFILKDFKSCSTIQIKPINFLKNSENITDTITRLDSSEISNSILKFTHFNNLAFEKMMVAAINRANFYLIDATIEESKIAVYKKPLGILIDKNLFFKLSSTNQLGLLFHESLRMLSIGFDFPIEEDVLEGLTCQAFSLENNLVKIENYNSLYTFIMHNSTEELINELDSISNLYDIDFPLLYLSRFYFLYQKETSKFENLRNYIPSSLKENLDNAFYDWAGREVPKNCKSELECDYFEEWPENPSKVISNMIKWKLISNDTLMAIWKNDSNQILNVNKTNIHNFHCEKIKSVEGIEFFLDRNNLDYFSFVYLDNAKNSFCIIQSTTENQ